MSSVNAKHGDTNHQPDKRKMPSRPNYRRRQAIAALALVAATAGTALALNDGEDRDIQPIPTATTLVKADPGDTLSGLVQEEINASHADRRELDEAGLVDRAIELNGGNTQIQAGQQVALPDVPDVPNVTSDATTFDVRSTGHAPVDPTRTP